MGKNVIQVSGGITINVNVSVKHVMYMKKDYIQNLATCSCENRKNLASIMNDSVITCDGIIEPYDKELFQQIITKIKQPIKRKICIV